MKNILCYGDSNTWGFVANSFDPETFRMQRYPWHQRWTGILQTLLGDDYHIIEEGLNGRTTNLDYTTIPIPRNGKTFLPVCLYTHAPIDLIVLMLGINDLKIEFNRTSHEIAQGMQEVIETIRSLNFGPNFLSPPKILLIAPPNVTKEDGFFDLFKGAIERSKGLENKYQQLSQHFKETYFLDANQYVQACPEDGLHLDEQGHAAFAQMISKEIKKILK